MELSGQYLANTETVPTTNLAVAWQESNFQRLPSRNGNHHITYYALVTTECICKSKTYADVKHKLNNLNLATTLRGAGVSGNQTKGIWQIILRPVRILIVAFNFE